MALNNVDIDTIYRIATMAKFLHEHETDVSDLKVQFDTPSTGLKARLEALEDDGLAEIQSLFPAIQTVGEFYDIAYIVTALVGDAVANGRAALAAVRKL